MAQKRIEYVGHPAEGDRKMLPQEEQILGIVQDAGDLSRKELGAAVQKAIDEGDLQSKQTGSLLVSYHLPRLELRGCVKVYRVEAEKEAA